TRVFSGGSEVLRLNNDDVILTPYVAFLATPTCDLFIQNWYQVGFSTIGNRLQVNNGNGLTEGGRLRDPALLQIDAQVGYWLVNPSQSEGFLRGLAPFGELHWNSALGGANTVPTGAFSFASGNNSFNELNASIGTMLRLGDRALLGVGATFP